MGCDFIGISECDSVAEIGDGTAPGLDDVASIPNLLRAWERVRRNNGAPGVDSVSIAEVEPQFPALAHGIALALMEGSYRPKPVRRVEIPKASGGTRKLGIPAVFDRIVQQALVQILQSLFEPHFSPCSFAYRPKRGPLDAVRHIQQRLSRNAGWVLHFDVANFFDTVPHDRLMDAVAAKVSDHGLLQLVRATITCGVWEGGVVRRTDKGVAQGSPLSPLLANAVLDSLDQWLSARGAIFARFADDCAVLVDEALTGRRLEAEVKEFLGTLSLALNKKKTVLSRPEDGVFLGFSFRHFRQGRFHRVISAESLAGYREALEARLAEGCCLEFRDRIAAANKLLNSWLAYYGATEDHRQIDQVRTDTEDALRLSEWRFRRSRRARERLLVGHGVAPEAAREAASASVESEGVLEVMRWAFPAKWFREAGLFRSLVSKPTASNGLDYSGRVDSGAVNLNGRVGLTLSSYQREWSYYLVDWSWIKVSLQLRAYGQSLLPRIVSVSAESSGQRIVLYW